MRYLLTLVLLGGVTATVMAEDAVPATTKRAAEALLEIHEFGRQLYNDGDYADTGESGYTTATLTDGTALITLPALSAAGTYRVRARVTDLAGNEGTSSSSTVTVSSVTAYSLASSQIRTSDPADGMSQLQLGNVQVTHPLDLDRSPGAAQSGNPTLVYNSSSVSVKPIVQALPQPVHPRIMRH